VAASALAVFGIAGNASAAPLGEKDLIKLIELDLGEQAIITKLQKDGIDFKVDDAATARLKTAGASGAVLEAVRKAGEAKPSATGGGKPVTYADVLKLVQLGIEESEILKRLEKSPTVFTLGADQVEELKKAGASDKLLAALSGKRAVSVHSGDVTDFAIVLDCSGSMQEKTPDGLTKMESAKKVVSDLVRKIPSGLRVTFVIYGHEAYGEASDPRNCQAVKIARPLAPLDESGKSELASLINGLRPRGTTPIALALQTAGKELAKNDALCGIALVTDGLDTCKGDPAGEAATLASKLKLTFGVNVIGFGVKPEENEALAEIAKAGKGKYYNADSAEELAGALGKLSEDLDKAAKPPPKAVSNRRAIKVLKPQVEFPPYTEIRVIKRGLGSITDIASGKYDDEIRIPSSTDKYEIQWIPKTGEPVAILKDFTLPERKVVEIKPEEHLGMIKVNGQGTPKKEILVYQRGLGSILTLQTSKKFGEIMVVPAQKVNVRVDDDELEEGLEVKAGTLHELE
jgi:hypothetical protein